MLKVTSPPVELRGIANNTSKKGNLYYTINVETDDGSPHGLYCPSAECLPQGLKKGEMIRVTFNVSYFKGSERLIVIGVERA